MKEMNEVHCPECSELVGVSSTDEKRSFVCRACHTSFTVETLNLIPAEEFFKTAELYFEDNFVTL